MSAHAATHTGTVFSINVANGGVPKLRVENLTITGLDWGLFVSASRVSVGEVVLELTKYTPPCQKIAGSFAGGNFSRVAQKLHPGWSRLYSRVLQEGLVRIGDGVSVA